MQFLFFCFVDRPDGSVAVDVNRLVHGVVRGCGIVHGESEIVPASPSSLRPRGPTTTDESYDPMFKSVNPKRRYSRQISVMDTLHNFSR
jgi:hypothetical protein